MKYLKYKIVNESDYYQSISHGEYLDLLNNKPKLDFDIISRHTKEGSPITMKDIGMCLSPYGMNELKEIRKVSKSIGLYFEESNFHLSDKIHLSDKSNKVILVISKLDDEWYLVSSRDSEFYKCDQLDGLINFLKSKKINESKSTSELYRRLDGYHEYEDKMNLRTRETFTDSEFKSISDIINQYDINYKRGPLTTLNINKFCIRIHGVSTNPEVTKSGDEYYYIEIPETRHRASIYYECDGFNGLEEMLRKILASYRRIDREKDEIIKSIISKLDSKSKEELLELKNRLNESYNQTHFEKIGMATFMIEVGMSKPDWDLDSMSVRDIEYLKNICDSLNLKNWNPLSRFSFDVTINGNKWIVYKKSGDDEWFYVSNKSLHETGVSYPSEFKGYKCDQLDGVVDFIKWMLVNENINESFNHDDKLCKYIEDDEYLYWRDKIIGCPGKKAIDIIKDQIDEIESLKNNRFNEDKFEILNHRITYNGNPLYGPDFDGDSYLKMAVSYCGDEWYLVECYYDYIFYTFLCDDLVGLEQIFTELSFEIEKDE